MYTTTSFSVLVMVSVTSLSESLLALSQVSRQLPAVKVGHLPHGPSLFPLRDGGGGA